MAVKSKTHHLAMRRKTRNTIIAIAVLVLASIAVFDRITHNNIAFITTDAQQDANISDFEKYHGKTFAVVKVVDGDTLDIDIPDSKDDHTRIRLWGIDTPETENSPKDKMHFGPEAKEFVKNLIDGKTVTIFLDETKSSRDKYSRLLAYIQLDDRSFLNEILLTEGYAYADVRFKHSFYNKYLQLEASARSLKKGLWKDITFDQLPEWLQRKKPSLPKK